MIPILEGENNEFNVTSRHPENAILSPIELPKLHKTIRSETLYSIKSQKNTSPHARMMQSIEKKRKKEKPVPVPESVQSVRSHESLMPTKYPVNVKDVTSRNLNNSNKIYEITTIDEREETSSQNMTQRAPKMSNSYAGGYAKNSKRYRHMNPDLKNIIDNGTGLKNLKHTGLKKNLSPNRNHLEAHKNVSRSALEPSDYTIQEKEPTYSSPKKSKLPKIHEKIAGITTQNGTFKPYSLSVRKF